MFAQKNKASVESNNYEKLKTHKDIKLELQTNELFNKLFKECEKEFKDYQVKQQELENSYTFDYKLMRRCGYPFTNDTIGALVKAVLTGDKTELEALNTVIEEMKTKYPKDDKRYTKAELIEQKKKSPCKSHFPDGYIGGSGELPWFVPSTL